MGRKRMRDLTNIEQLSLKKSRKEPLRTYYHSHTLIPISSKEIHYDSENEDGFQQWIPVLADNKIDEFLDINDGEKSFMKLWNYFIRKNRNIVCGDCHLPKSCLNFAYFYGKILIKFKLKNNFLLHLIHLKQIDLIDTQTVIDTMDSIKNLEKFILKDKTKIKGLFVLIKTLKI